MSSLRKNKRVQKHEDGQGGKKKRDEEISNQVLLNPDILEILFKHLDFTRLKLCRSVCKTWNEEICRGLRSRSVSYVQTQKHYTTLMKLVNERKKQKLPKVIQNLVLHVVDNKMLNQVQSVPMPVSKLFFHPKIDCHPSATASKRHKLLAASCSTLTSLKIPFSNIIAAPRRSRESQQELEFPLLEELSLVVHRRNLFVDHIRDNDGPDPLVDPTKENGAFSFFSKLVNTAPKLSKLEILLYNGLTEKLLKSLKLERITDLKIWTAYILCSKANKYICITLSYNAL